MCSWTSALRKAAVGAVLACSAGTAAAHDFWLQPASFEPGIDKLTSLFLMVGDDFLGEPVARDEDYLRTFVSCTGGERKPVAGMPGRSPAGLLRVESAEVVVAAYESRPRYLELEPEKFRSYLEEEGLQAVIKDRAARGESAEPGRERYVRCAKTLMRPKGAEPGGFDVKVGLQLELVPLTNPWSAKPVRFQVLEDGKPVAGVWISALVKDSSEEAPKPVHLRSDAKGEVDFDLSYAGTWLVTGTHMRRLNPPESGADWESLWASLTLRRE